MAIRVSRFIGKRFRRTVSTGVRSGRRTGNSRASGSASRSRKKILQGGDHRFRADRREVAVLADLRGGQSGQKPHWGGIGIRPHDHHALSERGRIGPKTAAAGNSVHDADRRHVERGRKVKRHRVVGNHGGAGGRQTGKIGKRPILRRFEPFEPFRQTAGEFPPPPARPAAGPVGRAREEENAVFLCRRIGELQRERDVARLAGQGGNERPVLEKNERLRTRIEQPRVHGRIKPVRADADHLGGQAGDQLVEERIAVVLEGKDLVETAGQKPRPERRLRASDSAVPDAPGKQVFAPFPEQIAASFRPDPFIRQIGIERLRQTPPRRVAEDRPVRPFLLCWTCL